MFQNQNKDENYTAAIEADHMVQDRPGVEHLVQHRVVSRD